MLKFVKIDVFITSNHEPSLEFLGSTLRGAFGQALKKVTCINPAYQCINCFASNNCLYYDFYEIKNRPHTYRFSKPLFESNFNFSLYLFENSCEKLPYIISAIHKMLTDYGLGIERKKFQIDTIFCNGVNIFVNGMFDLSKVHINSFDGVDVHPYATLHFLTPLRMKSENKLLTHKPSLEQVLTSIMNRLNEIKGLPQIKLPYQPAYREKSSKIEFKDLTRFSNRQQTKMQLGGIQGYIVYEELDERSYMLLKLGEILGVGKQTVFGLGEIKLENK